MKALFTTALLWLVFSVVCINAQTAISGDSLNIYNQKDIFVRLVHPDIYEEKKEENYKLLLASFTENLSSIKDQIPDYFNYKINYIKDVNLTVEEVTGVAKYQVENGEVVAKRNQNQAILLFGRLQIILYFDKIDDLLERDYALIIENGLEQVKKRKGFAKLFFNSSDNLINYSYSSGKLIKQKTRFTIVPNVSIGLFQNFPVYEFSYGAGLTFGQQSRSLVYIMGGHALQYNFETERQEFANYVGFGFRLDSFTSIKLAIPYNKKGVFRNFDSRMSIMAYPYKNVSIGIHMYTREGEGGRLFEFNDTYNFELSIGLGI